MQTMLLLDTDHCVFALRGDEAVSEALEAHRDEAVALSIITVGELYYGALRSAREEDNLELCQSFIDAYLVLPVKQATMLRFAEIKRDLAREGNLLPDPDLLIAATALTEDIPLVTHNTAHFERIEGLQFDDWCAG